MELQHQRELESENPQESDESESGSGLENRTFGCFTTPPDSPNAVAQFIREHSLQYEGENISNSILMEFTFFSDLAMFCILKLLNI